VTDKGLEVDLESCVYCFACANLCVNMAGVKGIQRFDHLPTLGRRIADSALAAMMTKEEGKAFFLNFAMDISPSCDCYGWTDTPIVNGLGILASYDPVAVDKACIDMMNAAPASSIPSGGVRRPGLRREELNVIRERRRGPDSGRRRQRPGFGRL